MGKTRLYVRGKVGDGYVYYGVFFTFSTLFKGVIIHTVQIENKSV